MRTAVRSRRSGWLVIAATAVALVGCTHGTTPESGGDRTFHDPEGRFLFTYPSGWERTDRSGGGFEAADGRAIVYVTNLPTSCDAKETAKDLLDRVGTSPLGQILDQGPTTVSGHAAYSAHFIDDNSEGPGLAEALFLVVEDDEDPCYQLSLTGSPEGFDAHRQEAEQMFRTFRFTTAPVASG